MVYRAGSPVVTATAKELARLREAYRAKGRSRDVVASVIRQA